MFTLGFTLCSLSITVYSILLFLFSCKSGNCCLVYFLSYLTLEFLYFKRFQIQIFKSKNLFRLISINKPPFVYANIFIPGKYNAKINYICINNCFKKIIISIEIFYIFIYFLTFQKIMIPTQATYISKFAL